MGGHSIQLYDIGALELQCSTYSFPTTVLHSNGFIPQVLRIAVRFLYTIEARRMWKPEAVPTVFSSPRYMAGI